MKMLRSRHLASALLIAFVVAGCVPSSEPPDDRDTKVVDARGRSRLERTPPTTAVPSEPGNRWMPRPGLSWQWQLTGAVDTSVGADVFDVDLFDTSAAVVSALHARGARVVCYMSAGSFEDWRPDASRFPSSVLGSALDGWPGERWLDIRQLSVLEPIMAARMDLCRSKGFDAVEPDNIDGYTNRSGFALSGADQLAYNRMLARLAHARGLAIGLKNDLEQVPQLVTDFDFAVNEECAVYDECEVLAPFVAAGKAVFHAEYELTTDEFCATSRSLGLSSIRKRYDLDVWRQTC